MKKFGHYEVTAELGRGGMGVVYKGFEPSLNRQVAIKCLGEHLLTDKDLVERFTREAKATAAVNHPNVIQIFYIGKEGEQPYFAMEYIQGQSLDEILKGGNSLPVKTAKNLLKQACMGMGAAHKLDLVHRDIKPANLMVTTDGILKVVDFGIARTREYGDKLTNTGEFVGTPGYLSPEVCIGKEVDERSDIFSLGIVFYEMLAGKVPFENDSPLGLMLEVVQADIPDIRSLNKKVDKKTSYILNKMIAKAPEDRYQTCDEVIRDLGNIIDNQTLVTINTSTVMVKASANKAKLSDQITLPGSDAIITAQNLTPIAKAKGGKKWLAAAVVFALFGASAFAYYNGYISLPNSSLQQTLSLADTSNNSTDLYPEIETDKVNVVHSELEGKGLMAGIDSMFANDSGDKIAVEDTTQLDFPQQDTLVEENSDSLITTAQQEPSKAGFQIDNTQDNNDDATESAEPQDQVVNTDAAVNAITETIKATQSATVVKANETMQSTLELPADVQTVAHNTDTQSNIVAEIKTTVPPISVESTQQVAQQVVEKFVSKPKPQPKPRPKAVVLNKGVVVIAFGDPAVANPIEKMIEAQLKQQGIKVMNEQFISGMSQLLNNGLDLEELKRLIQKNGGQAMVIANVNYVGSQQLNYAGRSSELINAQLDVDTYDIRSGESIGIGYGSKLSYTSLNATDEASDAVMQFVDELSSSLKAKI